MTARARRPKRDPKVVKRFLKKKGLDKVPQGKQVDHIIPLEDGGSNTVSNLQLLTVRQHGQKTAREARARAKRAGVKKETDAAQRNDDRNA